MSDCNHNFELLMGATAADLINGDFDPNGRPSMFFNYCSNCGHVLNRPNDERVPINIKEWNIHQKNYDE